MNEPSVSTPAISVDVISDVVCPWCYLGKRRLERAIKLLPELEFSVRWHPFQLDPTIPPGGIERRDYLTRKFGSLDAIAATHANLTALGEREGIVFRFDAITRAPNTVDAHRLIRWAGVAGLTEVTVERVFRAYFADGIDVGDRSVLTRLAADLGMPGDIGTRLASEEDESEVAAEIEEAYRMGVSGVPCFIIDRRYAVVGAHPPETLVEAISRAVAAREAKAAALS
jgi:predicted DsbA family dithiol-disulfide isomerase